MSSEEFSGLPKIQKESKEDLANSIGLEIEPYSHMRDVIEGARNGKIIAFVLTPERKLLLSSEPHEYFTKRLGMVRQECLIWDGDVFLDPDNKTINFVYSHKSDKYCNNPDLHVVCEEKIIQLFKNKGIDLVGYEIIKRK